LTYESFDQITEFPLCWPESKPRASERVASRFSSTLAKARAEVEREMERWGAVSWVISMAPAYRRRDSDPGCAVWWQMDYGQPLYVLACDTYLVQEHNLWALALTLHHLRGCERYGTYTILQAIEGARAALPPPDGMRPKKWWEVLGVASNWPLEAIELKFQTLAKKAHPDAGGSVEEMAALNAAIDEARKAAVS